MKATAQTKDRIPAAIPRVGFRPHYAQAPDGRTKKAYDHQPALLPWKCAFCIGTKRKKLLDEEKGRDHLSSKEINEVSFASAADLADHTRDEHEGAVQHMGQGQKTTNVLRREAKIRAAVGL